MSYVWAVAKISAATEDLRIYLRASGRHTEHLSNTGRRLSLFAHFPLDEEKRIVSTHIPIGESRELEILVFPSPGESVGEGYSWHIESPRGKAVGKCEITRILGKWDRDQDMPAEAQHPHRHFLGI